MFIFNALVALTDIKRSLFAIKNSKSIFMKTWAENLYSFYTGLKPVTQLPNEVEWLLPYQSIEVQQVLRQFLTKYFNDKNKRKLILGINPGRFGAGVTGINFTAPKQLSDYCHIKHPFVRKSELSAEFVYSFINAYGGPELFYRDFFIASVCPLGFVKHGKNINYYDDKDLWETVRPFIINSISQVVSFNVDTSFCVCMGGEKNHRFLSLLNDEHRWFKKIIPLPHPRFIMQYQRKNLEEYINLYLEVLRK